MKKIKICYYRLYQFVLLIAMKFLRIRIPKKYDSISKISDILRENKLKKVLIVSEENLIKYDLLDELFLILKNNKINYGVYTNITPNPTFKEIYEGSVLYEKENFDSLIAFGGGSVMDASKAILAVSKTHKPIEKLKGLLKVRRKLDPLICVPTTSGTGSETTIASVVRNEETGNKFAINSLALVSRYCILEPKVLLNLPPNLVASTSLDALTHAIESYIGRALTSFTKRNSIEAIEDIFSNIEKAYFNKDDIEAKSNLLIASYKAGLAFTRSYVGYVHSIAHAIGGKYNLPHGYLCAIILPKMLRTYGSCISKKSKEILDSLNIDGGTNPTIILAEKIEALLEKFKFKTRLEEIKLEDIEELAAKATKEANPLYPVPKILFQEDIKEFIIKYLYVDKGE